jgi:hypothetical protein
MTRLLKPNSTPSNYRLMPSTLISSLAYGPFGPFKHVFRCGWNANGDLLFGESAIILCNRGINEPCRGNFDASVRTSDRMLV